MLLCKLFQVNEEKTRKDIIAKTNDVGELEGDVRLLRDSQVVNKRLEDRETEITFTVIYQSTAFDSEVTESLIPCSMCS